MGTRADGLAVSRQPDGRLPAPGELRRVQRFVNTNDIEEGRDGFDTPAGLAAWLRRWTEWPRDAVPTAGELTEARSVREGLRALAAGDPAGSGAFGAALRRLDLRLSLDAGRLVLTSPDRLGRALAPLLVAVQRATADGSWSRLKVCARDRCRWLYWDSSRNASARWCSTQLCGNREKARRAYQRKTANRPGRNA